MSQEYFETPEASKSGAHSSAQQSEDFRHQYQRPNYLTVGNGSSENAHRLAAALEDDSGYGSLSDGSLSLMEDRPTIAGPGMTICTRLTSHRLAIQ